MRQKGFTLIELVVYIGLLSLVVVVAAAFILWILAMQAKTQSVDATTSNAERAMNIMESEIREADSIYTPTSMFDTSPGQLSLQTQNYHTADETNSYIDFFLCGQRLCMKKEGQNPIALTSSDVNVTSLIFHYIQTGSADSVEIDLTAEYNSPSGLLGADSTITLTSTASLRAQQ